MTDSAPSPASTPALQEGPLTDSPCLQGEQVAFTGVLASMTHREAMELVTRHGGTSTAHVTRSTTMLVVGEEGWPLESNGQPSVKWQDANELARSGLPLTTLVESQWLHLLGLDETRTEIHKAYTPAMLSQLLGVTVHLIRRWERAGLITAVRRVHRLPYFSFRDVASARRLSELLADGVPRTEIEKSLGQLAPLFQNGNRSLDQLEMLARDSRIVFRDKRGLIEPASGQRLLGFDDEDKPADDDTTHIPFRSPLPITAWTPERPHQAWGFRDWFDQGRQLLEDDLAEESIEAFRMCLMERPDEADAHFHLAEALFRCKHTRAALERYHAAVECDHDYIEAWTQLGCLHAELGELEQALDAFEVALQVHPDFPDAHWHKGEILHQLNRTAEAVEHWERYLTYDARGPWAETARQRLEQLAVTADACAPTAGNGSPPIPANS